MRCSSGCLFGGAVVVLGSAGSERAGPVAGIWLVLGLAVLSKGPVALVLAGLTLLASAGDRGPWRPCGDGWRPCRAWASACWCPWPCYAAMLVVKGVRSGTSFFGYHNLQRFSSGRQRRTCSLWWYFCR